MRETLTTLGRRGGLLDPGLAGLISAPGGPVGRSGYGPSSTGTQLAMRLALFAAWFAIVVALAAHHAPWRDEVRALSIARQGEGFLEMLAALYYEALWIFARPDAAFSHASFAPASCSRA